MPFLHSSVQRHGEVTWIRRLLALWAPTTHVLLSFGLSLVLLFIVDGSRVHSGERTTYSDVFANGIRLYAGDVTTMVSLVLVLIRVCAQSFLVTAVWWCALILLQHDDLDLFQLDTMLSFQLLAPSAWSVKSKHSLPIGLALLMMLPAMFIAPLLSGSIDWVATERNDNSITTVDLGGFGVENRLRNPVEFWGAFKDGNRQARQETVYNAQGNAALTWFDETPQNRSAKWGLSQYVALEEAEINSDMENVPMPYILVHNISWNSSWDSWARERLFTPRDILFALAGTYNATTYAIGNGILFADDKFPADVLENGVLYHAIKHKVAIMIGGGTGTPQTGENCKIMDSPWDDLSSVRLEIGAHRSCWAIGTVSFTAGIRYFDRGRFLTKQVVEGREDNHGMTKVVADPWAEYTTYMLSELMMVLPSARSSALASGNLTGYTEELMRHAYISMRSVLSPYRSTQHLKVNMPVLYLEAKVDKMRVLAWLILTLLLPASAFILLGIEKGCKQHIRGPIVSPALVPLLMDVREVLEKDRNGISNMCYLTDRDSIEIGKLKLGVLEFSSESVAGKGIGLKALK